MKACNPPRLERVPSGAIIKLSRSVVSRSPAFDLALTTRVLAVTDLVEEKGSTKFYGTDRDPSTGRMVAEFDCPADAW